jgi:hypothetical protein
MSNLVQVAVAGDVTEAQELQRILESAGIPSEIQQAAEADALEVLVPDQQLDEAKDAIEALTEPGDVVAEP